MLSLLQNSNDMTTRRGFLKNCAGLACACWFGSILDFSAMGKDLDKKPEINRDEAFALQWITELLESLDANNLSDAQLRSIGYGRGFNPER